MKLLLSFAALAVLATFTLASETASPPPPEAFEFLHRPDQNTSLQKNVQKSITYYCDSYDDCKAHLGIYSSCNYQRQCVCNMGYEQKGLDSCEMLPCSSNNDCSKFGLHTHCSNGLCSCDPSYIYSLTEEKCLFSTSEITTTYNCHSYDDCKAHLGIYSSCNYKRQCVCDMGYERKGFLGTCQMLPCSSNNDCSKFGLHTHCSNGLCSCDPSYIYNLTEKECRQTDNGIHNYYYYSRHSNNYGLIVGLPITIVGLIIILVAILLVRKKRLREEAVRRAAAIQRGVAQQGATVVINRQQANLQSAYNYPQNPLQNPPQNPTFTGYQPQPPPYYQQQPPQPETNPHVVNNSGHYPTSTFQNHYKN